MSLEEGPLLGSESTSHTRTSLSLASPLQARVNGLPSFILKHRVTILGLFTALLIAVSALALLLQAQKSAEYNNSEAMMAKLSKSTEVLALGKVIGDVIDTFTPTVDLQIKYGDKRVTNGFELKPNETASPPETFFFLGGKATDLYTLVMVDPDAPSPSEPTFREWLHWMVVNIPGGIPSPAAGELVVEYKGPTPPTGIHRYVFVLFKQKGGRINPLAPESRASFHTRDFAVANDLGLPVGVIYFNAQKGKGGGGRRRF
eukprot:TRINITY_DN10477_c0_g1_i1.p1 TRINITY_DN10477_c0_g1~~TRINITY_DN10477_c0_g1_i1.p1  ORF type:complete len:259 (-),score=41.92 TRINITY_DN10477_c0_g1_i1:677-1453(-)